MHFAFVVSQAFEMLLIVNRPQHELGMFFPFLNFKTHFHGLNLCKII